MNMGSGRVLDGTVLVAGIVPHALRFEFERVGVLGLEPVVVGVAALISTTADVAADETNPQRLGLSAHATL